MSDQQTRIDPSDNTDRVAPCRAGLACRGASQDPARFVIAAIRLFSSPGAAPLHDTLREDSPAQHLLGVMRLIDHHARRPLRLNPGACHDLTQDEQALVALIAAAQDGDRYQLALRCRTLVRAAGQDVLMTGVKTLADRLYADGVIVPAPRSALPDTAARPGRLSIVTPSAPKSPSRDRQAPRSGGHGSAG